MTLRTKQWRKERWSGSKWPEHEHSGEGVLRLLWCRMEPAMRRAGSGHCLHHCFLTQNSKEYLDLKFQSSFQVIRKEYLSRQKRWNIV